MSATNKIADFWSNGFATLGSLFDQEEVAVLKETIDQYEGMQKHRQAVKSKYDAGQYPSFESIFVMDDVFGDNVFALACRKPEIINFVSDVFDDDAYLHHYKVPLKYSGMPGFRYHQDYFYWYRMGCVFPRLATCFIALDPATEENGCLSFIPNSHDCGRIEHIEHNGVSDSEADQERVEHLKNLYGERHMTLQPGEVCVFHCNTLHGSTANRSSMSRLAVLGCFNTKGNSPLPNEYPHPSYAPQERFYGKISASLSEALPKKM